MRSIRAAAPVVVSAAITIAAAAAATSTRWKDAMNGDVGCTLVGVRVGGWHQLVRW